jgi:nucleotide-binding universal stress UspA family protein
VPVLETIAVGTDGSPTASKAVEAAVEMARRFDSELVLLSAFKNSHDVRAEGHTDVELQWTTNKDARVREILARTEQELRDANVDCRTMIDEGDPADVLIRLAEECDADLLVIGNKGLQRRILGSVPNTVTHRVQCSVYVVKTS